MSHRRGLSCLVYKICRCDSYSIKRHDERRHVGETDTVPFYTVGMEIARDNIIKHETHKIEKLASVSTSSKEGKSTNSKDSDTADTTIIPTITIADKANANIHAGSSLSQIETESEITKSEDLCDMTGPENLHKSAYEMITTKSKQSTLNFAAKVNKAEVPKSDLSLESKIDNLVREFQDFKLSIGKKINVGLNERQKPSVLSSISAKTVHEMSELMTSWPDIKNIIEMTDKCKEIQFFGGGSGDLSVLRCKTCFDYLTSFNDKSQKTQNNDIVKTAKKGVGKYVIVCRYFNIICVYCLIIVGRNSLAKIMCFARK